MNETKAQTNVTQPETTLVVKSTIDIGIPFDVEEDLKKYDQLYITKEYDPFRLVHCFESPLRDYKIHGVSKSGDKKHLFTAVRHFECCVCCDQCVCGYYCCGYACCDSIQFQMDYKRNGETFYTQGYNIVKGCHCCDVCILGCFACCACSGNKLYLRENIDPNSPDINVGRPKGKTVTNCFCSCDKYADYRTENKVKGQTVRAECCDICTNYCINSICSGYCAQGCDLEMSIENENGLKTGNVLVYSGCCSKKVEGKCCYLPRPYFEVNMSPETTSEQKFQIIADIIHLDLANNII